MAVKKPTAAKAAAKPAAKKAAAKKENNSWIGEIEKYSRQIWLAGLGAYSKISNDGNKLFDGLVKDGAIGGLSIGYRAIRERLVGKARHLIEVALHEVSLVTIPMNEKALITSVKSIIEAGQLPSLSQFEDFLREAGFSKSQAAAIAGKGLSSLLRGEPGSPSNDFLSALARSVRA